MGCYHTLLSHPTMSTARNIEKRKGMHATGGYCTKVQILEKWVLEIHKGAPERAMQEGGPCSSDHLPCILLALPEQLVRPQQLLMRELLLLSFRRIKNVAP